MTDIGVYLFLELIFLLRGKKEEDEEGVGDANDASFNGNILLIIKAYYLQNSNFIY